MNKAVSLGEKGGRRKEWTGWVATEQCERKGVYKGRFEGGLQRVGGGGGLVCGGSTGGLCRSVNLLI